jgi:hypothetical protein
LDKSDDDDDNPFPVLQPMHVGSAGCFAHKLQYMLSIFDRMQLNQKFGKQLMMQGLTANKSLQKQSK